MASSSSTAAPSGSITTILSSIAQQLSAPASSTSSLPLLLSRAHNLISALSLFSSNDELADISTSSLRAILLDSFRAEALTSGRVTASGDAPAPHVPGAPDFHEKRLAALSAANDSYVAFLSRLLQLSILPAKPTSPLHLLTRSAQELVSAARQPEASSSSSPSSSSNPFSEDRNLVRERKIEALKLERAIQSALDDFRHAYREKRSGKAKGGLRVQKGGLDTTSSAAREEAPSDAYADLLVLNSTKRGAGGRGGKDDDSDDAGAEEDSDEEDGSDDEARGDSWAGGSGSTSAAGGQGSGIPTPKSLRGYLLLLLCLHASRAISSLRAAKQELELLRSIPSATMERHRLEQGRREAELSRRAAGGAAGGKESDDWKLDRMMRLDASSDAPLLDSKGRVLRPFQILPGRTPGAVGGGSGPLNLAPESNVETRSRLAAEVFRPSHRLPSMTIDEFLQEEERRGNIITGGGHEGAAKMTPREQRRRDAEDDGTRKAEEEEERDRQERIEWDEFADANKRGAGNTMSNRG